MPSAILNRIKRLEAKSPGSLVFLVEYMQDGERSQTTLSISDLEKHIIPPEDIQRIRIVGGNDFDEFDRYLKHIMPDCAL